MAGPDILAQQLQEGVQRHRAGALDQAGAIYDRVLAHAPANAEALHLSGVLALDRGEVDRALTLLRLARGLMPYSATVLAAIGAAHAAKGDTAQAIAFHRRALAQDGDLAIAHLRLGELLFASGEALQAATHAAAAVTADPTLGEAWGLTGRIAAQQSMHRDAAIAFREALLRLPHRADLHAALGNALLAQGDGAAAAEKFHDALAINADDPEALLGCARARIAAEDVDAAIDQLHQVVTLAPDHADAWNTLGDALSVRGDTEAAIAAFRRVVALRPDAAPAWRSLAAAAAVEYDPALIARLQSQFADPALPMEQQLAAAFAAAMILDRHGREEEAFPIQAAAKARLRRAEAEAGRIFDPDILARYVGHRIETMGRSFLAAARDGVPRVSLPVFVVGMPRSGTTLVEQILASHPAIHGVGEGPSIGALESKLPRLPEGFDPARWAPDLAQEVARDHLARLAAAAPQGTLRIVDKTPDNIFHVGLIAALFPGARIIFCERDPRDICLSCYFQWFKEPLAFANDLADCATRLMAVDRLRRHWNRVLPQPMLTLRYERLIAAPEAEARRLIAFLGLDWDPACLDFHRNGRAVRSSSLWQVRRPIYDRSVGRWQRYRRFLAPLLSAFGDAEQPAIWPDEAGALPTAS
ncbi:MAG: sulfotransferase [Rhodospirillales bacterium]|nr:sulfotransferase [Rhodospirillales bacterium]